MKVALAVALRHGASCIDVGAHEGSVLADMVRLAPHSRHLAFEPLPHLASELRVKFPTVDVREIALSDASGQARFTFVRTNPGYSGFRQRTYPGVEEVEELEVVTATLDECIPPDLSPAVIKIDVEGAEAEVLRGAAGTLSAHRPLVFLEHGIGGANHYGTTSAEIFELLSSAGLRIFDSDGVGPYSKADFCESFTLPMWNWMAL